MIIIEREGGEVFLGLNFEFWKFNKIWLSLLREFITPVELWNLEDSQVILKKSKIKSSLDVKISKFISPVSL